MSRVATALIVLAALASASQNALLYPTAATRHSIIALAEILAVRGGYGARELDVKLVRVLRAPNYIPVTSGEFKARIPPRRQLSRNVDSPWSMCDVQAGQTYLIFGDNNWNTVDLVQLPESVYLVRPNESAVEDIELILPMLSWPVSVQARKIALEISESRNPRSFFLAEQAAALLAAGTSRETIGLAEVVADHPETALSDTARASLISFLWSDLGWTSPRVPENLLVTFVTMVARYFAEPDPWGNLMTDTNRQGLAATGMTPMQRSILSNYLPRMLEDDALNVLRTKIDPSLFRLLHKVAADLSVKPGFPSEYRARLEKLLHATE